MEMLRVWTKVDIDKIEESILIVDDLFGFCPGCKEMGIKLEGLVNCPKCKREFRYVTSREARNGSKAVDFVKRVAKKLPDLIFIDYEDYEYLFRKKKAEGLFNK